MESKPLDLGLLRSFSPLDGLKSENLQTLARKTVLRDLPVGRVLFKEGDSDKRTYYLVSGVLELIREDRTVTVLRGGSPEARNPIAPFTPRRYTARAVSDRVEFIALDSDMLDMMLTWDQTGSYEVSELSSTQGEQAPAASDDWMTTLLQTKAFHRIPPANIQAIFMRMQRLDAKAGDVIIKQGDDGDYFYVIVKGKCLVTRETPLNKAGIKLAELGMGDTFGEEALIADAKRNANITMLTDGALMRLAKDDFRKLLNEPMLNWVDFEQGKEIVAQGGKWLDVRLPSEFENFHMEGALNLPLYFIRLKLKTLDPNLHYVVVCDTGRRSSAAAYILAERDLNASVLKGGLSASDVKK
ncbi:cyclic nucleotide-binding domain-containing protein [Steroidobacter sp.]|uniref:cyclic nucleotide-binding domain-containing protein n=1 Tax=Steroidobacter sp. TaxID=1978227 RepID=UPI001A40F96B|nr:cyclic nucleotide-binding domain-containing protein [Steroidobacter sp.]MBL8266742.1 cyclic nucleotide-binding domain-containing protein [Steroidobacter sp.]